MIKEKICPLKNNWCMIAVILLAGMLLSGQAFASYADYGFYRVTDNSPTDIAGQLNVRVWDYTQANAAFGFTGTDTINSNEVLFTFTNNVGIASSISEIYFDDGTIISQSVVYNSLGGFTEFVGGSADPSDLPGGNTVDPPFVATQIFSADAQGNPDKGVDTSSDILGISFRVNAGFDGINDALSDGSLRIGLHVRAIGAQSDSFVNNGGGGPGPGPTPIPEPATMLLLGTGLAGIAGSARRRKKNQA